MKIRFTLFLFCLLIVSHVHGQYENDTEQVYTFVDRMPDAGYDCNDFFSKNIHYPDSAIAQNIEGRVIIRFVVNKDGHISGAKVVRGIGGGCDEEALRVVSSLPPWKPGARNGSLAKVSFVIPVEFKMTISDQEKKEIVPVGVPTHDTDIQPLPAYDYVRYIGENIDYPRLAWKQGKEGVVFVKFAVNEDGSISDVSLYTGVSEDLDAEAMRIVKGFPKWKPGTHNGKPVLTYSLIPITFLIQNTSKPVANPGRGSSTQQPVSNHRKRVK